MAYGRKLSFTYSSPENAVGSETAEYALKSVDIEITKGEFIAVLGRNGSGKSTLARHLNALLTPTEGTLWIKGMETGLPEHTWDIRQTTGMVFQNPDNQLIASVVEEDVAFGPENLGVPPKEIRARVDDVLAAVDMTEYAKSAPQFLSGGQKQRVAIAGVLAMKPDCIVLDEPTAMLDPSGRREVLETVLGLNKNAGITVILITHYMEEAALAGRVIVMDGGKPVMDGKPAEIFKRVPEMKALGLDVPGVAALSHKLAEAGLPINEISLSIEDFLKNAFIKKLISEYARETA